MNGKRNLAKFGLILLANRGLAYKDQQELDIHTHLINLKEYMRVMSCVVPVLIISWPDISESIQLFLKKNKWFGIYEESCLHISIPNINYKFQSGFWALVSLENEEITTDSQKLGALERIKIFSILVNVIESVRNWINSQNLKILMVLPTKNVMAHVEPHLIEYAAQKCPTPILTEVVPAGKFLGPLLGLHNNKPAYMPSNEWLGQYKPKPQDLIATGTFYIDIKKIPEILLSPDKANYQDNITSWAFEHLYNIASNSVTDGTNGFENVFCDLVLILESKQVVMPLSRLK